MSEGAELRFYDTCLLYDLTVSENSERIELNFRKIDFISLQISSNGANTDVTFYLLLKASIVTQWREGLEMPVAFSLISSIHWIFIFSVLYRVFGRAADKDFLCIGEIDCYIIFKYYSFWERILLILVRFHRNFYKNLYKYFLRLHVRQTFCILL